MTERKKLIQNQVKTRGGDDKFGIYKSNVANWRKGIIEVATDTAPSYIVFKIEISNVIIPNQLIGSVKEVWLWSEDSDPRLVVYPALSEWQAGTEVQVSFDNRLIEFHGMMSKV